ncbi:MAG: pyrroline-5-carboxylate reductase [Phycisphaerae bacterium]|nr:pyrroline-5-carboxylate reductase [Phycisphaerae bacterium]
MTHPYTLGVIGTGHIAGLILRRLIDTRYYEPQRIIVSASRALAAHPLPVAVADDIRDVVRQSSRLLISVTPQKFREMSRGIEEAVTEEHLLISVMAGVHTDTVAARFPHIKARVVRTMPNLPFGLGFGVTGVCAGKHALPEDVESVRHLFNAGGVTVLIHDERLMDAVTAVAGSGPAYFYYFVEAMMAGGIAAGLPAQDAQTFAAYACMGAGAMLLEKGASPQELRQAVTSPNGTTEAAMRILTSGHVTEQVTQAVLAAFQRGQELGQKANAAQ